jgi:hypothetical protein
MEYDLNVKNVQQIIGRNATMLRQTGRTTWRRILVKGSWTRIKDSLMNKEACALFVSPLRMGDINI